MASKLIFPALLETQSKSEDLAAASSAITVEAALREKNEENTPPNTLSETLSNEEDDEEAVQQQIIMELQQFKRAAEKDEFDTLIQEIHEIPRTSTTTVVKTLIGFGLSLIYSVWNIAVGESSPEGLDEEEMRDDEVEEAS